MSPATFITTVSIFRATRTFICRTTRNRGIRYRWSCVQPCRQCSSRGRYVQQIRAADPELPITVKAMTDVMSASVGRPRLYAAMTAVFASVALLLGDGRDLRHRQLRRGTAHTGDGVAWRLVRNDGRSSRWWLVRACGRSRWGFLSAL